jgi:hypothetical protein
VNYSATLGRIQERAIGGYADHGVCSTLSPTPNEAIEDVGFASSEHLYPVTPAIARNRVILSLGARRHDGFVGSRYTAGMINHPFKHRPVVQQHEDLAG